MQLVARTKAGFDYALLKDLELEERARGHARAIRTLVGRTAANIVEIGRRLLQAKLLIGHGYWLDWLQTEFECSPSTALGFMRVAEKFGNLNCLESFQPSALILLSYNSTPAEAVSEAIEQARNGQHVTHTVAHRLCKKHRPNRATTREQTLMWNLKRHIERLAEQLGRRFIAQQLQKIAAQLLKAEAEKTKA